MCIKCYILFLILLVFDIFLRNLLIETVNGLGNFLVLSPWLINLFLTMIIMAICLVILNSLMNKKYYSGTKFNLFSKVLYVSTKIMNILFMIGWLIVIGYLIIQNYSLVEKNFTRLSFVLLVIKDLVFLGFMSLSACLYMEHKVKQIDRFFSFKC